MSLKNPSANCFHKFKRLQLTFQVVIYGPHLEDHGMVDAVIEADISLQGGSSMRSHFRLFLCGLLQLLVLLVGGAPALAKQVQLDWEAPDTSTPLVGYWLY